jgi:predicted transcriptional regulator
MTSTILGSSKVNSSNFQFAHLWHENNAKGTRRGKLDIVAEILFFCEQPKTKTSIMYNTNLNYAQLKRHMESLTTQGLLAKKINKYNTTDKGHEFLNLFVRINDLVDIVKL